MVLCDNLYCFMASSAKKKWPGGGGGGGGVEANQTCEIFCMNDNSHA